MSKCISNVLITLEVRDSGRKRRSINDSASCLKKLWLEELKQGWRPHLPEKCEQTQTHPRPSLRQQSPVDKKCNNLQKSVKTYKNPVFL